MKIYAKCPEDLDTTKTPYLTPGKMYEVFDDDGEWFDIYDDDRDLITSHWGDACFHLNGLNWNRIEVKTRADVLADEAENMAEALRWIAEHFENVNMSHVSFRTIAKRKADAILARIDEVKE